MSNHSLFVFLCEMDDLRKKWMMESRKETTKNCTCVMFTLIVFFETYSFLFLMLHVLELIYYLLRNAHHIWWWWPECFKVFILE